MEQTNLGSWKKLRVLGSGGFGQVTLWYNSNTGQKLAVKKLHEHSLKDATIHNKQVERWCNEVEIMKKLSHANIVATLEVPPEMSNLTSLPVLAMEYCSKGDLRQVLNQAENCCGLRESDVCNVLRDVSSGLAYLHSCKIIHRDLKPDNIVLQEKDFQTVYKLIDLGYAKSLDQSSLSKSFVGTVQYIAPELFMGKAYTSSVDYWSFGLLAHEIATGFRPFLPGLSPSDWMKRIQNKARKIICVYENFNGDITFTSRISRRNQLSRRFLENIEEWLRLALDWDGQTRGRNAENSRIVIFEELSRILRKKIIDVFSVPTCEIISYEVNPDSDILEFRQWLKNEIGLPVEDQLLLLRDGKALNGSGNLMNCLKGEKFDRKNISIFMYNIGLIEIKSKPSEISSFATEILASVNSHLAYGVLKRSYADSIYFLRSEEMRCRCLLQALAIKIVNIKQKTLEIETIYEEIGEKWNQIESFEQFLSFSHKIDLENYIYLRKAGKLKTSALIKKWIQNVIDVNKKMTELKNSYNKNDQKQLVLLAKERCRNLEVHPGSTILGKTPLNEIVSKGEKLWENIQKVCKEDRKALVPDVTASHLINLCIQESNKFINSESLKSLFLKISEADENLVKFLSHLTTLLKSLKILKLLIENTQKERQKEVWDFVGANETKENRKEISSQNSIEVDNIDSVHMNGVDTPQKEKSLSNSNLQLVNDLSLQKGNDSDSLIEDNNQLRYRMQEVQQKCQVTIAKTTSLLWDELLQE